MNSPTSWKRQLQGSIIEGTLWDEVFSKTQTKGRVFRREATATLPAADETAPETTKTKEDEKTNPPLSSDVVAKITRVVDRVFGSNKGGEDVLQEIRRCYERICHDRLVLSSLLESPGIEQRTPQWYAAREGLITASDFAQALGQGKFGTQKDFFMKKVDPEPFRPSPALKWGVMFEPVASDIYCSRNGGIGMHEFGLMIHPRMSHVGASPDGITDAGVMVEIKCPFQRRINGEVPYQYYCQIQGQLDVCGLRCCDYLECEFDKYDGEDAFWRDALLLAKEDSGCRAHAGYSARTGREKGVVAEYVETSPEGEKSERYVYGPLPYAYETADAYKDAVVRWKEGLDPRNLSCMHWWHLRAYSVIRVDADEDMTRDMMRDLERIWNRVLLYRSDRKAYQDEIIVSTPSQRASGSSRNAPEKARPPTQHTTTPFSSEKSRNTSTSSSSFSSSSSAAFRPFTKNYAFMSDDE